MLTQVTPVTKPPAAKKKATTRAVSDGGHAVRIAELTTVVHSYCKDKSVIVSEEGRTGVLTMGPTIHPTRFLV